MDVCLQSVRKFWRSSLPPLVLATPECHGKLPAVAAELNAAVHLIPQEPDQRRGAVYLAMTVDHYSASDAFLFLDADCMFTRKSSANDFCRWGQPVICMDSYDALLKTRNPSLLDAYQGYRRVMNEVLGLDTGWEYMQRMPMLHYRDTIKDAREKIEWRAGLPLHDVMERYPSNHFSEFNLFGAVAHTSHELDYTFEEKPHWPKPRVRWFHSWSMTVESQRAEIDKTLAD